MLNLSSDFIASAYLVNNSRAIDYNQKADISINTDQFETHRLLRTPSAFKSLLLCLPQQHP